METDDGDKTGKIENAAGGIIFTSTTEFCRTVTTEESAYAKQQEKALEEAQAKLDFEVEDADAQRAISPHAAEDEDGEMQEEEEEEEEAEPQTG